MQLPAQSRITVVLTSWLLCAALGSAPVRAADVSGDTIRASASEVRIAFAASDQTGRVIKSLRSSDVAVTDNGTIIRHFRSFRPATATPLDVVLLLDGSASVELQLPEETAKAKSILENTAWKDGDRVSILAFGGLRPQLLCARNCRRAGVQAKLSALRADGLTPLYDALLAASEILSENRDPESRPAMILLSDGNDTISRSSMTDALQAAEELQAPIYTVNSRAGKSSPERGDAVLVALAANTGGLSFGPGENIESILRLVLDDLHGGYVLTYEPPEQGSGEHTVHLLPTGDARLQFRSRRGYDEGSDQ